MRVLAATIAAAGSEGLNWDWKAEERALRAMCSSWLRKHPRRGEEPQGDGAGLPVIKLRANDIERIVNEAEAALIEAGRGLYQRDGKIAFVDSAAKIAVNGVQVQVQSIAERGDFALREDLCSAASFQKYDARSKGWVATDPPMQVVQTLKQREAKRLTFPILSGVINSPTLRHDGSILSEPGYDFETGLLFDPRGVEFRAIPEHPTQDDAKRALAELLRLLADSLL
jgi:putative DNA primase/helicase